MKFFIVAAVIVGELFGQLSWAGAPSQAVVGQWINASQAIPASSFAKDGRFSCHSLAPDENPIVGYAEDQKNAQTSYLLQCLQKQCKMLGQQVYDAAVKVKDLSDEELTDFMHASGATEKEILIALTARKTASISGIKEVSCMNATPLARMFVFDSCFSMPMKCRN